MANKKLRFYINFLILLFTAFSTPCHAKTELDMTFDIEINPQEQIVTGIATTRLSALKNQGILIGQIKISKVEIANGIPLDYSIKDGQLFCKVNEKKYPCKKIRIYFTVPFTENFKQENRLINKNYVFLTGRWCPLLKNLATYRLNIKITKDFTAISEADEIVTEERANKRLYSFIFNHPRQSVALAAAHFFDYEFSYQGIRLSVHLLKKDLYLAQKITKTLKTWLQRYQKLISPYPFRRFQVVEVPAPIGISVPTITFVGTQIIGKPFFIKTSLIHELAHSWFGNSVFVNEKEGNWSEGLTTYLADYLIAEREGKGTLYRHDLLSEYKAYIHGHSNSFSLSGFRCRYNRISKAIGYNKGAMVFHMLRRLVGDKIFFKAVSFLVRSYQFHSASWHDIEKIFSKISKIDLKTFFQQWLERKDVPRLKISDCAYEENADGNYETRCIISQLNALPYALTVPLQILTEKGAYTFEVNIKEAKKVTHLNTNLPPRLVIIDPDYDIMRDLEKEEFPPSLSRLFGAEKKSIILPDEKELFIYSPIISFLKKMGFKTVERKQLKHSMLKKGAFLVLGSVEGRLERLTGTINTPDNGMLVKARENPLNSNQVVVAIRASSNRQVKKAMRKLPHYGQYSFLKFKDGNLSEKRRAQFVQGISNQVCPKLAGIFSNQIKFANQIAQGLEDYKVVYLGEKHDQQGIHQAQLEIIKRLSKYGPLAVGMEMFQRPFQKVIDRYLAGEINEHQFLKQSEYFKRWAFNYHFYRPIVEFCKENNIPIVALNLPTEISKKIARTGLVSLTDREFKQLPKHLNLKNELYRRYLKQVYAAHRNGELQDFQYFFEAQIAWDETMAHSIASYLERHPDYRMVIIVGGGHVEFGYGIPSRVKKRLPSLSQAIALFNESSIDISKADLFLYAPSLREPFTPKLGVILNGKNKLTVERVIPGSPASDARLQKGDRITKVDGVPVKDIYDLKLELFFKKKGDRLTIQVKRKDAKGITRKINLFTGKLRPFSWQQSRMGFHLKK